jgi:hypothetical protein
MIENEDGDERLSVPTIKVLHAALLILLAWNLTELPRAANDFGEDVRINSSHEKLARTIATVTLPTDVIATNSIGAIGWFAERRVIDISGHLTKEPTYNERILGPDRGLLQTLVETRPQYLAIFGEEYSAPTAFGMKAGFLQQMYKSSAPEAATLFRVLPQ